MSNYTVIKIQFETLVSKRTTGYYTRSATRVHYLQPNNTIASLRYDPGELKMVLDQDEGKLPYLTGDDVLHVHPSHLKDIQTSVIRYFG